MAPMYLFKPLIRYEIDMSRDVVLATHILADESHFTDHSTEYH